MIKFLIVIILMVFGLFDLGCASMPASLPETRIIDPSSYYDQVRESTTTKEDIKALLGKPNNTSTRLMAGGQCETWWYMSPNYGLIFTFNQNGIVTSKHEHAFSGGHSTIRSTTHCIFRTQSGAICGQPAITFDAQKGPLCLNHAPNSGVKEGKIEKGKRSPSEPIEED